jgi:hypothetical protein
MIETSAYLSAQSWKDGANVEKAGLGVWDDEGQTTDGTQLKWWKPFTGSLNPHHQTTCAKKLHHSE